ncbi:MAG: hypothetical protein HY069_02310 [Chlamydiia bacterium]|nr:hypothetical protein [Chlamydiia bacterium]
MATSVSLATPAQQTNPPVSCGQRIRQMTGSYFSLQGACWKTALKVASYFTVILPVLMWVLHVTAGWCSRSQPQPLPESTSVQQTGQNPAPPQTRRIWPYAPIPASQSAPAPVPPQPSIPSKVPTAVEPVLHSAVPSAAVVRSAPSAIQQTVGRKESFFVQALLNGNETEATALWEAMQAQQPEPTEEDQWAYKAFTNNADFTQEEIEALPLDLKEKLYQIANIYQSQELIDGLAPYIIRRVDRKCKGAAILSCSMGAITVHGALESLITQWRTSQLLLKRGAFDNEQLQGYVQERGSIGSMLGLQYIQGLSYLADAVKFPKKIAVIEPLAHGGSAAALDSPENSLAITVSQDGKMTLNCPRLCTYAEPITLSEHKATRKEMGELLRLLTHVGYQNFSKDPLFPGFLAAQRLISSSISWPSKIMSG